jgi:hypothetical protein
MYVNVKKLLERVEMVAEMRNLLIWEWRVPSKRKGGGGFSAASPQRLRAGNLRTRTPSVSKRSLAQ